MTTNPECQICSRDLAWHLDNETAHQFAAKGQVGALKQLGPRKKDDPPPMERKSGPDIVRVQQGLPQDPVLRMVLLRRGIITLEELAETEKEVRDAQSRGAGVVFINPLAGSWDKVHEELDHDRRSARDRHPSQPRGGDGRPVRVGDEPSAQGSLWPDC